MGPTVRAVVEYDGTRYHGFQRLPGKPTIQGTLEAVCARLMGPTRVHGASRTDAGVHAQGQVVSFEASWRKDLDALQRALNALLPPDIAVTDLSWAPHGFHARRDAIARWYRYTILNTATRSPLRARFAHHVTRPLDVDALAGLLDAVVGTHDFGAFASGAVGSTVRTVHHASISGEGSVLFIDLVLSSAFSHLVRRLVGSLIDVGCGTRSKGWFLDVLSSGDRRRASAPAPPQGLCLMEVYY